MRLPHRQIALVLLRLLLPLTLAGAFAIAVYTRFYSGWIYVGDLPSWPAYVTYFAVSTVLWLSLEPRYALTERFFVARSSIRWLWPVIKLDLLTLAVVSSAAFFWRGYSFSRFTVAVFWTAHVVICYVCGTILRVWLDRKQAQIRVLLVGPSTFEYPIDTYLTEQFFSGVQWRGGAREAIEVLRSFESSASCQEVFVVLSLTEASRATEFSEALQRLPVPGSIAIAGLSADGSPARSLLWLSDDFSPAGEFDYVVLKRLVDICASLLGLVALSPVLLLVAIITWARSGLPVWIAQDRVGRRGRRFRMYKFRSLPAENLTHGDFQWTPPQTDPWGNFLRTSGIDELPQLWNVVQGEMSLIGPRPERPHFAETFRRQFPSYSTRHRGYVGITGWAQVHGLRGDTSISARVEHDLYYLRHWSVALDFRILAMTVANFFRTLLGAGVNAREREHAGPA